MHGVDCRADRAAKARRGWRAAVGVSGNLRKVPMCLEHCFLPTPSLTLTRRSPLTHPQNAGKFKSVGEYVNCRTGMPCHLHPRYGGQRQQQLRPQ